LILKEAGGHWRLVSEVLFSARHEGDSVLPVQEFPCFVYVACLLTGSFGDRKTINRSELEVIGIGELYRSEDDARHHRFS
jgi:hypothetical protein